MFTHEGRDLADSLEIANAFNVYFANIGKNLSSQIDQNIFNADYKQYLTSPTKETLQFKCITKDYTIKALDNFENKNSSGHDGISNTLLKIIKNDISQSLTIIINQMLTTGIFPDAFKLSKVIHYSRKVILPFWLITDLSRYCQQYQRFLNESFTIKCTNISIITS